MANKRTPQDYLNAPIEIYKGFLVDSKKVLFNVIAYACYDLATTQGFDFKEAANYFNVTFNNLKSAEIIGQQLFSSLPRNTAFVGISKALFRDYLHNDKTDKERAYLLCYVAIKSIIGNKKYCKLNNNFMLSRMDGNNKTLQSYSPEIERYNNHYQCKELRTELELSWGLITCRGKGIYCSFLLSRKALNLKVERYKKSYLIKQLQQDKKEAKLEALQTIWQQDKDQHGPQKPIEDLPF